MRAFLLLLTATLIPACLPVLQGQSEKSPSTPEVILTDDALESPRLEAEIPSKGARAILSRVGVNDDVETWLAVDNISVSFRNGVLVASRGLGFDLMGADASGTLQAFYDQEAGIYRRQMRYLNGENRSTYLTAGCTMALTGTERFGAEDLLRYEESCQTHRLEFTNVFWLDSQGTVRRSKQWLSPEIGYLTTRML